MAKYTIIIEDLPENDPAGNIRANINFDPPPTKEQQEGKVPLTFAQTLGAHLTEVTQRLLNAQAAADGDEVINVAPGKDGVLAEVSTLEEGKPSPATGPVTLS